MIQILNVEVWKSATQCGKCETVYYGGLIVDYWQNGMGGQVKLDIPENVAMNLTLNDIKEHVVLKLRGVR